MTSENARNLDRLMGVTVRISAELGRCSLRVRDVLNLGIGSIVALDCAADGPIDVLVNDAPIARGEVIAVGDRFGVRITELVAPPQDGER